MTGLGRRRRRAALGLAVIAASALLVWLALRATTEDGGSPRARAVAPVVSTSTAPAPRLPADEARHAGQAASPATLHDPEERQVCGAWVRPNPDGSVDDAALDRASDVAAVREHLLDRLRSGTDEYPRAVAVWTQGHGGAALVSMALATRDPRVYALAFQSCRSEKEAGPCDRLDVRQWVRLDPGNAAPWLFALNDAASHNDRAGVDEALFQIANARRNEQRLFLPTVPLLDAASTSEESMLGTWKVTTEAAGMMTAATVPYAPLVTACRPNALLDVNRRQLCAAAAEVLAEGSDDMAGQMIGARVATHLGGSPDRIDRKRAALEVFAFATLPIAVDPMDAMSCPKLRADLVRSRQRGVRGEAGEVQDWVAQSGRKPDDLLAEARAIRARRDAATAAAVTAAEAASSGGRN